jgi:ribose 5-phosphate isomerase A
MAVIADESKWVKVLGAFPLPIEVLPFGLGATKRAIEGAVAAAGLDGKLTLRQAKDGHVFVTDGGHWIVDAALGRIPEPKSLAGRLAAIPGVMEHGLFVGMAEIVILAGPHGVRVVER